MPTRRRWSPPPSPRSKRTGSCSTASPPPRSPCAATTPAKGSLGGRGPPSRGPKPRLTDSRGRELQVPKPRLRREAAATGAGALGAEAVCTQRSAGHRIGTALGIAVVVAFLLFLLFGSECTIDAPSIHGVNTGKSAAQT